MLPVRARFAVLVATLALAGCAAKSEPPGHSRESKDAPAAAAPAEPMGGADKASVAEKRSADGDAPKAARALIVTIDLNVSSERPDVLAEKLRNDVVRSGGFIADATASGSGPGRSHRMVLRVPAGETRALRATLADYGKITNDTEKTEDVTEQRADVTARLANARTQEKRLQEIMAAKTATVAEVLEVERELARVRETIERFDAQKRALDGKIDLATVTVNISAPSTFVEPAKETAGTKIKHAFFSGIEATGTLLLWAAMALAALSPVLIPLLLVATGLFFWLRKRRRAQRAAMPIMRA